jgi:hypothetical protein
MSLSRTDDTDLLEQRVAAGLIAHLSVGAQDLPADVAHRLARARRSALARVSPARSAPRPPLGPFGSWRPAAGAAARWSRAAAWAPLAVLLVGLAMVAERTQQQRVVTLVEVDAALLSDDLPPEAYDDAGFVEFLRTAPRDAL